MATIKIDREKCKGCHICIAACARQLIAVDKSFNKRGVHPVYLAAGQCLACTLCAQVCPDCCIEVYK